MAGIKRRGQLINLAQRQRRRAEEALIEAKGQMIEAEHALFVALRLAGHQNPVPRTWRNRLAEPVASVVPLFPGGKRAA
jgi:hypothetical protein